MFYAMDNHRINHAAGTDAVDSPQGELRIALFPGSFDPFTIGHADIVKRALAMFDKVVIGVGVNENKRNQWSAAQRVDAIRKIYCGNPCVEVVSYECLTVDIARQVGADFILRGIRSVKDFEYERDIAGVNKRLSGIETVFLLSDPAYADISSGVVRELMAFGKDVSAFLPHPEG